MSGQCSLCAKIKLLPFLVVRVPVLGSVGYTSRKLETLFARVNPNCHFVVSYFPHLLFRAVLARDCRRWGGRCLTRWRWLFELLLSSDDEEEEAVESWLGSFYVNLWRACGVADQLSSRIRMGWRKDGLRFGGGLLRCSES